MNEPLAGADHERYAPDVAGYVLGGLSVAEQRAFEAHLATCEVCRDELAQLDPIPVLLELARPVPAATATTFPTVAESPVEPNPPSPAEPPAPAGRGSDRRRRRVLVGAAVALALVVGLGIGLVSTRSGGPTFSQPVTLQAVGTAATSSPPPAGSASWRPVDAGTVVRLDLAGLEGDGTYYECLWISRQGSQSAGTFRAGSDGQVRVDLTTAAAIYPGWHLEVRAHGPGDPAVGTVVLDAAA